MLAKKTKKPLKNESVTVDYSEAPKKKSLKSKSSEDGGEKKALKKKKPRTIESAKNKIAVIQQQLPTSEQELLDLVPAASSQEKQQIDEYLHMFRKLSKLIRKAEKQCMQTGQSRDYYALCTLMSQQREVIADIRSVTDMSGQVEQLDQNVLQPMSRSIGQNMLDTFYQLKKLLVDVSKPTETQFALAKLNEITTEQGKFLQLQYSDARDKVSKIMLG